VLVAAALSTRGADSGDGRVLPSVHGGQAHQTQHLVQRLRVESRTFYNDVIGLDGGEGLDWILFFGTDKREVQLSVMALDVKAHQHPVVSIEVDDVDQVYARAVAAGAEITYPITDEDWGLRRFFVRDPNGAVINVTQHED
jgi:predicted enzyme related to lactoylglutathione lyase